MDVEQQDGPDADLHCRVPALAGRLADLRRILGKWATRVGLAAQTVEELVLASYEALANAVEHAYRDRLVGLLDLRAHADRVLGIVTVTVTDYGCWRPPPADPGSRGWGLTLIRESAAAAEIAPVALPTTSFD
jgi:anti-sigma regulatory factor (Ser/Thr protein kinase)